MAGRGDELVFAPLGGVGEIGMNLAIYGFGDAARRQWIAVDLGVSFAGDDLPGIDLILPDIRFLVEERRNLLGLVLTHAHEDHFGALLDLWPRLKVPIYATPFTAALLEAKRAERAGRARRFRSTIVPLNGRFTLGPFDIELVSMAHSIPESNGLIIRTRLGTVLHTGDWKIDPDAGPRAADRRDEAARARRRGLPGADRRFRPTRCARAARPPRPTWRKTLAELIRTAPGRVGGHHLRVQRGAPARGRRGGGRLRPRGRGGRPRHGADRAGRARDRLSRRHSRLPLGRRLRLPAARQGRGALHRQPGRAARGARAHRRGRASRGQLRARRPRDLLLARHSRATRRR